MDNSMDVNELFQIWGQLSPVMQWLLGIVMGLLVICAIVSVVVSIYLFISYHRYNKKANSIGMTGEQIARKVLDDHGLQNIKVKCSGSILFGNSYSHYFKKVRLRRLTWKKSSVSSMAMAVQKSCLAVMDKEGDPDMKTRVRLTPWIYIGPVACIPLIIIGAVLDILIFNGTGKVAIACTVVGLLIYALSFVMSLMVLKTEIKAQQKAYTIAEKYEIATAEEIADMRKLFHLYNIEYVNNMITALLELLLRVLTIIAKLQVKGSDSVSD